MVCSYEEQESLVNFYIRKLPIQKILRVGSWEAGLKWPSDNQLGHYIKASEHTLMEGGESQEAIFWL
jgi:hypothetical protein